MLVSKLITHAINILKTEKNPKKPNKQTIKQNTKTQFKNKTKKHADPLCNSEGNRVKKFGHVNL